MLLEVKDLSVQFGGLKVIEKMNFSLNDGELIGLIGPNGAGKTTAFNLISGIYQPTSGQVLFAGESLTGLRASEIARRGIVRTFQNIRLFQRMSVAENVLLPMHMGCPYPLRAALLQTNSFVRSEEKDYAEALRLLEIFDLKKVKDAPAGALPYGVQRKIEIVRALAAKPKLILLDEPAAGMNHSETAELMRLIAKIRKEFHLTVLLIEHDMKLVMGICERIVVLDHGMIIAQGIPREIQSNPKVIEAYLGIEETAG